MSDILPQAVTAFSTLAAAALGGWIVWRSTAAQLRHQSRTDSQRRFIEKMETLHGELTRAALRAQQLQLLATGTVAYRGKPDLTSVEKFDTGQLNMLTDFYAPELKPFVEEIDAGLIEFSTGFARICLDTKATAEQKGKHLEDAVADAAKVERAVKGAKAKLRQIVGPHTAIEPPIN